MEQMGRFQTQRGEGMQGQAPVLVLLLAPGRERAHALLSCPRRHRSVHEGVELGDDIARVGLVLQLALAVLGAAALEGPDKTDVLASELRDLDFMAVHQVADGVVGAIPEAAEEARVGVGVKGRDRTRLGSSGTLFLGSGSALDG